MELEEAIRDRRTHKVFASEPVEPELLNELFELARWAPNHHLTNPWRFRVLGPQSLAALKLADGPEAARKLDRAPTLVAVSQVRAEDPVQDEEDLCAVSCAAYIVLLAAHSRGLVGYWRTPAIMREDAGRAACGIPAEERALGLLYLGGPRQPARAPEREPVSAFVTHLA